MLRRKLSLASLVLVLGVAAASGASAAGVATPGTLAPIDGNVVAARSCPITILCRKGTVPKCGITRTGKCGCRCVPRHPID
jgi:hypothetical protein